MIEEIVARLVEDRCRLEGLTEEQQLELISSRIKECPPLTEEDRYPPEWWHDQYEKAISERL